MEADLTNIRTVFLEVRKLLRHLCKGAIKNRHFMLDLKTQFHFLIECTLRSGNFIGRFQTNGLIPIRAQSSFSRNSHPAIPHAVLNISATENNKAVFEDFGIFLETNEGLFSVYKLCTEAALTT